MLYANLIEEIRKIKSSTDALKILDIGCGGGNFIKAMIDSGSRAQYFGADLSLNMIQTARDNVANRNSVFLVADGYTLPFPEDFRFDVIHLDSVFHHLIGSTPKKSVRLIRRMVEVLISKLDPNGMLIVEEVCYNSYIYSNITSFLVFYGLRILNKMKIDLHKVKKEIRLGLEVNFLSENQLLDILKHYGYVYEVEKTYWIMPRYYKLLFLKNYGIWAYILTNHSSCHEKAIGTDLNKS